ncbi:MAG: quinol:cytochrome C oxidoreductase [Candidatus Cyclobacteriaceae bacterium M3_2C_046]
MVEEKFEFTKDIKKWLGIVVLAGVVLTILGIIFTAGASHGEHGGAHEGGHAFHWSQRLWVNVWVSNVYFAGIALIGVFFVAIHYASQAGWSAAIKRIPESFGAWLPFAGIVMLVVFIIANHDIFHWTHDNLDPILLGKKPYLNYGFFVARLIIYFVLWYMMYRLIRKKSLEEDVHGGTKYWHKLRTYSAIFIIIFGITSSTSSWDWVMSADPHWFSTIFGWYTFATWFVAGLSVMTLIMVYLKESGYLGVVNANHYHDMGKYIFAFSIFWTYLWFSQYMLIWYANIPEESLHYYERLHSPVYGTLFYVNIIINFFFPFLVLMTRDSKRHGIFLKIVGIMLIIGHWIDLYLFVAPTAIGENGGIGFMEIGVAMIFGAAFLYVALNNLAKAPLVAKHDPMMGESLHYHA